MKKIFTLLSALFFSLFVYSQDMVVTGVFDGPLPGGLPKAIELYVINDIPDLSTYGIGSANNGSGSDGIELQFSGSATAGNFLYVGTEDLEFNNFFGFVPDFISDAASINGDDAIELFGNVIDDGTGTLTGDVIDLFGEIDVDGTGEPWEYLDGWAYRNNDTGPDGNVFEIGNWSFSGVDANDDDTSQSTATNPWPIGTYSRTLGVTTPSQKDVFFYPNPAKNFIYFKNLNKEKVSIYNVIGQSIPVKVMNNRMDISNLMSGIYIVHIKEGNKSVQYKLIVE